MAHTKGEWETAVSTSPEYKPKGEAWDVCMENGGDMLADLKDCPNAEANAKHIVKCVNSHTALLEACKEALVEWTLHGALTDTARTLKNAIKQAEETYLF